MRAHLGPFGIEFYDGVGELVKDKIKVPRFKE